MLSHFHPDLISSLKCIQTRQLWLGDGMACMQVICWQRIGHVVVTARYETMYVCLYALIVTFLTFFLLFYHSCRHNGVGIRWNSINQAGMTPFCRPHSIQYLSFDHYSHHFYPLFPSFICILFDRLMFRVPLLTL